VKHLISVSYLLGCHCHCPRWHRGWYNWKQLGGSPCADALLGGHPPRRLSSPLRLPRLQSTRCQLPPPKPKGSLTGKAGINLSESSQISRDLESRDSNTSWAGTQGRSWTRKLMTGRKATTHLTAQMRWPPPVCRVARSR
jgi:hypothetical protein